MSSPTRPFKTKTDRGRSFSFSFFSFDGRRTDFIHLLRPRRLLIRQSVETRSYSHHFTSHTTRKYNKINPTHERKYRITMFRVRRARRRTRGRGACAWRRPWTRTRWPRCSRRATTTATSAAPPPPTPGPQTRRNSCFHEKMVAVIHRDLARRFYQDFS